jgi:outer membrane protein assembly factor BamE (lipoprotein component of BamABCDE complex)
MLKAIFLISLLASIFTLGCGDDTDPCAFDEVGQGMNADDVTRILGKPLATNRIFGPPVWVYYCSRIDHFVDVVFDFEEDTVAFVNLR